AYVGMTRAKDLLYLVHARHRSTWGVGAAAEPSRFLAELPEELLSSEREEPAQFRRTWGAQSGGGWQRRGTDDSDWTPGGYRSPRRSASEPLRPVNLPDLAAPGRELDRAKERVASTRYQPGEEIDLGSGAFTAPAPGGSSEAPAWRAGDKVRHRRFGEGIVVSSRIEKNDEWVTVAFVGQEVKELIAAYAGLERI
ncbi:MAG: hypothetical protein OEW24_07500, partial [Chloroflexota bacterium]|nr:hypothetical protein [Chloroflexota bacterium]